VMETHPNTVLCVNLMDEAQRRGVRLDVDALRKALDIPVVTAAAGRGEGVQDVRDALLRAARIKKRSFPKAVEYPLMVQRAITIVETALAPWAGASLPARHVALQLLEGDRDIFERIDEVYRPSVCEALDRAEAFLRHAGIGKEDFCAMTAKARQAKAAAIARAAVTQKRDPREREEKADAFFTSPIGGFFTILLLLTLLFYITVKGANIPSAALQRLLFSAVPALHRALSFLPAWLAGALVDGVYRTAAWVTAVMLPPMAIFFPLFTLLEDIGYLPRMAFQLDSCFRRAGGSGRQSLTMSMSLGCNACGVTGCRIIKSPRERLLAILTASFIACNGRFPTLISLLTVLCASSALFSSLGLGALLLLGVGMTLFVSLLLSRTALKGESSFFALELPPYRMPRIGQVLLRSLLDRTLFVLGRAVAVAAPAGLLIYALGNLSLGGSTVLCALADFLQPIGQAIGLSGPILLAFLLSFPANEIMLPALLMCYFSAGTLMEVDASALGAILMQNGWGTETFLCALLFCLFHFPCSTTCLTVYKETGSIRYTALAIVLPTAVGAALCCAVHLLFTLF